MSGQIRTDMQLRRRISQLADEIKHQREQEIKRAVDYKNVGNDRMAAYHTGLADGRNSMLTELRALTLQFPEKALHETLAEEIDA